MNIPIYQMLAASDAARQFNAVVLPIFYVVVGVIIFLALREFWLWYFKINSIERLLKGILAELQYQNEDEEEINQNEK